MRMKKHILMFVFFVAVLQFAAAKDSDGFNTYFTVSVQPYTNWYYNSGYFLDYQIKPSLFTTVELGLRYKDWVSLILDFDYKNNDNFVGKVIDSKAFSRIAGQLGIKNFAVHAAFGQLEGTATWKGPPVPGQPETAIIGTKYTELALMYVFEELSWLGLGLMYINYNMPIDLGSAYQDSMTLDYYGVYYQQSYFRWLMDEWRKEGRNGFGIMFDANLSMGIALSGGIDEEGRRRMRFGSLMGQIYTDQQDIYLSGRWDTKDSTMGFSGTQQIILGVCGGINLKKGFLGFGAGYDGFAHLYVFDSAYSLLIRHGFTMRAFLSF